MDRYRAEEIFSGIFNEPTIHAMHDLKPSEFEEFVAYVFRRAGYKTKRATRGVSLGIDLKLYSGPRQDKPAAYVDVRRYAPSTLVGLPSVLQFRTALALGRVPGYLVTTSNFTQSARNSVSDTSRATLVNGEHLRRYIQYVLGSRYEESTSPPIMIDHLFRGDSLPRCLAAETKVLAIANNKGGVGKTTTALNIALGLAEKGKRVLLVDMDAQANLTELTLGVPAHNIQPPHLMAHFASQIPLHSLVQLTPNDGVWLISGHPKLLLVDSGGAARPDIELGFATALHQAATGPSKQDERAFDWIVLDTPPAMSMYTRCALAAAHYVLAPARPHRTSISGLENTFETLRAMRALSTNSASMLGCVVTHWEENATATDAFSRLQEAVDRRKSRVFDTKVPVDNNIDRSYSSRRTGRAATAYSALVEEVLSSVDNA